MEAACIPHSFGPPINSGYYSKPFFANGIASKQFIQGKNYVIDTQPTLDRLKNKKKKLHGLVCVTGLTWHLLMLLLMFNADTANYSLHR